MAKTSVVPPTIEPTDYSSSNYGYDSQAMSNSYSNSNDYSSSKDPSYVPAFDSNTDGDDQMNDQYKPFEVETSSIDMECGRYGKTGFSGANCDIDIDECEISNPCGDRAGMCSNTYGSYE